MAHPSGAESSRRCTSDRRSPHTSPRRSPARASSTTISRSRAEQHAPSNATMSASDARSTGISGSCSRCRARIRHDIRPSPARAASGRSRSSATSYSSGTRPPPACPAATACTTIPRTAVSTALILRADRAGLLPGPVSTIPASPPAPIPEAAGSACRSQVMNNPSCSAPACQLRPVRAHHRRNNAIAPAYAFVVDSAPSRPNRSCRKKASATATTARSSSSTVQYRIPDGNVTGNARIFRSPRSRAGLREHLPATSNAPEETRRRTLSHVPSAQPHAAGLGPPEN